MRIGKRVGQIFRIPLDNENWTYGIIIFESKRIKDGVLIGIYDALSTSEYDKLKDVESGKISLLEVPNYTSAKIINKGDWPLVLTNRELAESIELPVLRVAYSLFKGDEEIGRINASQVTSYPTQQGQGKIVVENRARHLLGLRVQAN